MIHFFDKAVSATGAFASGDVHLGWMVFKDYLEQITNLHEDALHIYAAVGIQLAVAFLLRRSLASFLPWLSVLAALVLNEVMDLTEPGRAVEEWQVLGGLQDLWNTMAVPTLLLLIARFAPSLVTGKRNRLPNGSAL
jgi:hypothetical protein